MCDIPDNSEQSLINTILSPAPNDPKELVIQKFFGDGQRRGLQFWAAGPWVPSLQWVFGNAHIICSVLKTAWITKTAKAFMKIFALS